MIYRLFMEGKTSSAIARHLAENGILSPGGKKNWQVATINSILSNEKYKGDALLQKSFTVDFLSKKMKENEGEVPQYYVQNSHPAIIEADEFDAVQVEIERRKKLGRPAACQSPLSTKLICGECGGFYGSKVWGSNTKYRRVIWRCNEKYIGDAKCSTPHVTEEEVKQKFLEAFNSILEYREELIDNCRIAQKTLCDCTEIDKEIDELNQEIEVVAELSRKAIHENAQTTIDQAEWNDRNNGYLERHRKALEHATELEELKRERQSKSILLDGFIQHIIRQNGSLSEFDDRLWMATISKVTVQQEGNLLFRFKDGTSILK